MEIALNSPFAQQQIKAQTALMQVIDPELGINIIDLGLVYAIDFSQAATIVVTMTFSTPHCPLGDAIKQGVTHVLGMAFPDYHIGIQIVWEPEWNADMITDEGKTALGINN